MKKNRALPKKSTAITSKNHRNVVPHKKTASRKRHKNQSQFKPRKRVKNDKSLAEKMRESIFSKETIWLLIAVCICVALFSTTTVHRVDGESMEPTFQNKDRILIRKTNDYSRYDIVTFAPKENKKESYVKRIIGMPGDYIWVRGSNLFLLPKEGAYGLTPEFPDQAKELPDNTLKINLEPTVAKELSQLREIPAKTYFVQGDNRNHSTDSRSFGLVDTAQIEGVVRFRYYPFNTMGIVQ
ncbi:signal peptidase I [Enterococcus sp. AZ192]|uniref:signal peptidase I n=1 Tax=unclassified Enterococcus TaxID=2608891 RepID=UPI003D2DA58E